MSHNHTAQILKVFGASLCYLLHPAIFSTQRLLAWEQTSPGKAIAIRSNDNCPREVLGSIVAEPRDLASKNGVLNVALQMRNSIEHPYWGLSDSSKPNSDGWSDSSLYSLILGHVRYCYIDEQGDQAPTLHLQPGDTLILTLKNEIMLPSSGSPSQNTLKAMSHGMAGAGGKDPCVGGPITAGSTNLHFHGLSVTPVCHQDETIKTLIQPGAPPFKYRIEIPKNQPPGLYWYHPHVHGFSEEQILGGASGALIVEGMEHVVPRIVGLPERVFVIRDEKMPDASDSEKADPNRPTKQLSINYVPVPYPKYPTAIIKMKPRERQFWRVLNASADTYLNLSVDFDGQRQNFDLVALDGVPLHYGEPGASKYAPQRSNIFLPPGGRAEFVVIGPPAGVSGTLRTSRVYRGAEDDAGPVTAPDRAQLALRIGQDDVDPSRPLATLIASTDESTPRYMEPFSRHPSKPTTSPLSSVRPVRKRKLYFSEKLVNPGDPQSTTLFFITEDGHLPVVFNPVAEPNITVRQGEVEDWVIENRSREVHVFHIHQMHFLVVGTQGAGWEEPTPRDTINLPAWDGFHRYPSVTLRMDFRDPQIVGTVPFHCHILQHVDGGMMGTVRVEPAQKGAGETETKLEHSRLLR